MDEELSRTLLDWSERTHQSSTASAPAPDSLSHRLRRGLRQLWQLRRVLLGLCVALIVFYSLPHPSVERVIFTVGQVVTLVVLVPLAISISFSALPPSLSRRVWRGDVPGLVAQGVVVALASAVGLEVSLRLLSLLPLYPPIEYLRAEMLPPTVFISLASVGGLWLLGALRERSREVVARERDALQARLEALRARTHPHFLFNSLNTLAGLIEEDPSLAVAAVNKLAALLRHSLERSRQETISLSDELEASRIYLELEELRYGDRLRWNLQLDPGAADVPVPPLCIQPLVENAVRHGVADRREGGQVDIAIERTGSCIRITVRDDGPGPGHSDRRGTQTSLADLEGRLSLLYGDSASLELKTAEPHGCEVQLSIPTRPAREGSTA